VLKRGAVGSSLLVAREAAVIVSGVAARVAGRVVGGGYGCEGGGCDGGSGS